MKIILMLIFSILGSISLFAQQTVSSAGGNATGSGGAASYTVGQVVYTTNTGSNGSVASGVQQPYEISVVTGIEEAKGINLVCYAYPNPATDFLKLKIENYEGQDLRYQLYDINGNLLLSNKVVASETNISMQTLLAATYFLRVYTVGRNDRTGVTDKNKVIKTFKIIKN